MSGEAHPALHTGLAAIGLYDREGTARLGHDVADCPCCGQMMRVDGWAFRCYAQCDPGAIAGRLRSDARFVNALRSAA